MKVTLVKPEDEPLLKFKFDISDEEYSKLKSFGHELKCYMLFADNRLKDTNDFIYYNSYYDEDRVKNYSKIFFEYYNRINQALVIYFEMTFYYRKNFIIDDITLIHRNSLAFINESNLEFRKKACNQVQIIIEHLLNRNEPGSLCSKCLYGRKQEFNNQCNYIYFELKDLKVDK